MSLAVEFAMEQPKPIERLLRPGAVSRVIREGTPEPLDDESMKMTPEERIDAVWVLTKECMGWNGEGADEPRLRKDVIKITRRRP